MNYENFIDGLGVWIVSWRRVILAAFLTTLGAIVMAQALLFLLFPVIAAAIPLYVAPTIAVITAFPLCVFVWSLVLRNSKLSEELRRVVNRDQLTDVATRDYFFDRMEAAPASFGVSLMLDIDHFKMVNDTYGHLAGDLVIQRVAKVLKSAVRADDLVCRFGGEEFLIFLFNENREGGIHVAERMRLAIADNRVQCDGALVSVTVSIGGSLKAETEHINSVIQKADESLYRAKEGGRNRTVFDGSEDIYAAA